MEKFFYLREIFKYLFSCVVIKCKIFFFLLCVKSEGKLIIILYMWLICLLCVRLEWGGVYFDNGDFIFFLNI